MSTSFLLEHALRAMLAQCGLRIEIHPDCDPCAHDADWRIFTVPGTANLFQGTMDRCSDFVRGYRQGTMQGRVRG